jgi:hypothetical protein
MHTHTCMHTYIHTHVHLHTHTHTYTGEHQSSYLSVEILTVLAHRSNFGLSIFCLRHHDGSSLREAIESIDGVNFRDVSALHTAAIADTINAAGVHVLIDMDAHFRNSRLELMAYKSAPVRYLFWHIDAEKHMSCTLQDCTFICSNFGAYFSVVFIFQGKQQSDFTGWRWSWSKHVSCSRRFVHHA